MVCNKCKKEGVFRFNKSTGRDITICVDCLNERQRLYRAKISDSPTKSYEKTYKGYIMRMYRNMKSRVAGIQKKCSHRYKGLELLPKEEFYKWIENNETFKLLFDTYKANNHLQKLAPSVDRINPELGYTLDNIRILTLSDNVKLARPTTKLTKQDVINIREDLKIMNVLDVADKYGTAKSVVYDIKNYRTFKNL